MIGSPRRLRIRRNIPRLPLDALARAEGVSTSFVADAMDGRGVLDPVIKPLKPDWRIAGRAVTAFVGAGDNLGALAAIDLLQPGDVLVIATGGHCRGAVLGDNMGMVVKRRGAVGVVTDGALRDGDELIELGLACFCRTLTPASAGSRGPGEAGLPVTMGTSIVASGDLLIGDRDGVIAVANVEIPAMLDRLDLVREKETATNAKFRGGDIPSLLHGRYPDIDAETDFLD